MRGLGGGGVVGELSGRESVPRASEVCHSVLCLVMTLRVGMSLRRCQIAVKRLITILQFHPEHHRRCIVLLPIIPA